MLICQYSCYNEHYLIHTQLSWASINEPRHEIPNNVVCPTNKGSDQPAHTHSLIIAFASDLNILWVLRTSGGGNGNQSVSLPIILIKIKIDQMHTSSYISSLLVSILWFWVWFPISMNVRLYFGAKMITFCIIHIENRKIFSKHHPPESQLILLHVSVFSYFT